VASPLLYLYGTYLLKEGSHERIELGWVTLIAFGFVDMIWGVTLLPDMPPVRRKSGFAKDDLKALEAGIPIEGAELITPKIEKKVRVR